MPIALLDEDATIEVKDSDLGLPGGDEDTTYTVRVVTPQVAKRIRKAHTQRKPNPVTHRMEDVTNHETFAEALWDYVMKDWTGPLWKGKPVGPDDMVPTSSGEVKAKTQLDGGRKAALLEKAGANEVVDDPSASFRGAP